MYARVLEQMLEGEMDAHLSYEKPSPSNSNSGNSRNSSYEKKIQTQQGEFELIVVPKHQTPWLIHKTAGNLFVCQRHECFGHRRGNERNLRHHPFNLRHIHYHQQNITGSYRMATPSLGKSLPDRLDGWNHHQGQRERKSDKQNRLFMHRA